MKNSQDHFSLERKIVSLEDFHSGLRIFFDSDPLLTLGKELDLRYSI
jgi:hypothetical protein